MKEALEILKTSLRVLTKDWISSLKIFGSLGILQLIALVIVMWAAKNLQTGQNVPLSFILIFIGAIALIFLWCWMAVAFHRHVLIGESNFRFLPPLMSRNVWNYFGVLVLIGFILLIPAIIISMILGITYGFAHTIAAVITSIILYWISGRLSVVLAGRAIDNINSFSLAWGVTKPASVTFWILSTFYVLADRLISGLLGSNVFFTAVSLFLTTLLAILSIAVITVTYDRYLGENKLLSKV